MLLTAGERISMALLCMAIERPRRAGGLVHRLAGRDRHRHRPRQGEDPRGPGRPDPRRARRRAGSRSSPGSRACRPSTRHHHARPRRLRHHRGRARGRARRRRVRDLHRRRRRLHRRPAHRARRARKLARRLVRRDARDGGDRRPGARAAIGRVRRATTACRCTCVRASRGSRAPGSTEEERSDGASRSSRASPTTSPRRRSRSSRSPTARASRRRCSATLADDGVNVDMIVQNVSTEGHTDISFTVPRDDARAARRSRWTRSSSRSTRPGSAPTSRSAGSRSSARA